MTSKKRRKIWRAEYRARFEHKDKLAKISRLIDWEAFRPILEPLFKNNGEGRPHEDVVLMTKVLVLQSWYGLSDETIESECKDRLTFQNFLGYPEKVPDQNTIWLFRERLAKDECKKEKEIWQELQRQLDKYRMKVRKKEKVKDVMLIELGGERPVEGKEPSPTTVAVAPHTGFAQDSSILDADPGVPTEEELKKMQEAKQKKEQEASSPQKNDALSGTPLPQATAAPTPNKTETKPRGNEAMTRRSKDGTWTKKHDHSYFGFKLHTKNELDSGFIDALQVTTASLHDSNIDLTNEGEVCVRDRGYPQGQGRGLCIAMIKATRGHPLTEADKKVNRFLAKVRAPIEHSYATIKRVFHAGLVFVTTRERVEVKMTFVCTCYNLSRARTISSQ